MSISSRTGAVAAQAAVGRAEQAGSRRQCATRRILSPKSRWHLPVRDRVAVADRRAVDDLAVPVEATWRTAHVPMNTASATAAPPAPGVSLLRPAHEPGAHRGRRSPGAPRLGCGTAYATKRKPRQVEVEPVRRTSSKDQESPQGGELKRRLLPRHDGDRPRRRRGHLSTFWIQRGRKPAWYWPQSQIENGEWRSSGRINRSQKTRARQRVRLEEQ